jgi:DNA modification methylase
MDGKKADMVFTDPPYGMNVVKKDGNNNGLGESLNGVVGVAKRGKYKKVIGDDNTNAAKHVYNLCVSLEIPVLIFWGANFYAESLRPSSGWIVWDKENGEGFFADGELAWTNSKKQLRIFKHQWKGMIRASEMGQKRVHPTQKPIALAEWCFENYGKDCNSVIDLFGGSGSTLIACEKTSRQCYMMELDPHYVDVIVARWENYTGLKAKLLPRPVLKKKKSSKA